MRRSFETVLVEQCAPTLAGVKPGSLFRYQETGLFDGARRVWDWDRRLRRRGLELRLLKVCCRTESSLVYVFRREQMERIFRDGAVLEFLAGEGYDPALGFDGCLARLEERLCAEGAFPHELGLFLGYPLEDVAGFIANGGRNYTCCGCWKAYGDPETAQKRFALYRRCTDVYRRRFAEGTPILQLAVAA